MFTLKKKRGGEGGGGGEGEVCKSLVSLEGLYSLTLFNLNTIPHRGKRALTVHGLMEKNTYEIILHVFNAFSV